MPRLYVEVISRALNGSLFLTLSRFFHGLQRDVAPLDHFLADLEVLDLLLAGQVIHEVEHEFFQDHAQAARAYLALHGLPRDGLERALREFELYILEFEHPLVLLDNGVARPRENLDQGAFVEIVEDADNRQTADEFGDQA